MKILLSTLIISFVVISCNCKEPTSNTTSEKSIEGTWKLFYGSIKEKDSLAIRDVSQSEFIKIINDSHFAFFNQVQGSSESFYGGAGTYTLIGDNYEESLDYIGNTDIRGHKFPFTIALKGDTLIQHGHEKVEASNIDRYIVEKYVRIK